MYAGVVQSSTCVFQTWDESANLSPAPNEYGYYRKIISAIPNCSKIIDADKVLYEEFLKSEGKKHPYHYSRSWVFIKQISNGQGIKYFDKKKEHLITIAPNWGESVPNYVFTSWCWRDSKCSISGSRIVKYFRTTDFYKEDLWR